MSHHPVGKPAPEPEIQSSWLNAALAGSSRAFAELLEAFRPQLLRLAAHHLGSSLSPKESVSDLAQESLMAAAIAFPDFRGKTVGEFHAWIARILERRAIDLARRFRNEKRDVSRELKHGLDHVQLPDDSCYSPPRQVAQAETLSQLVEHLNALTNEERLLVEWRYRDELSFEEISQRLGWPRETTRRRWYDVIGRIGRRLEE